ncbi:MAG: methionine adenosyltransferase [Bacteroidales bacterium]|nr:methionine adenosyltransferase [Bacteroidales bacterium]MDD5815170.1 methionine adenosyltransferase [Bacteroidales bacterium]MDY4520543.1 methionine adenosyltransferase [Bacteroidales bacterium]
MAYFFTSESVSEGHPDKVADQISDAVLDALLAQDEESKVACETLVTTGLTVVAGELNTNGYVSVQDVARKVIDNIGYNKSEYQFDARSCGVISALHEQSHDINQGVVREDKEKQGAGDQGMMFGYACRDTEELMPLPIFLAHRLLQELSAIRREGKLMTYLRPDSKSQVTIEYSDDNRPLRIDTIVISTQHDDFASEPEMLATIAKDVKEILLERVKKQLPANIAALFEDDIVLLDNQTSGNPANANKLKLFVNPTGKFVIGGPHGDTGLTGRKIIVDTYGGKGAHGGGAFSGKDPSKVDRSAAYAARHVAKNLVAAGVADEVLVEVAYAIGIAEPVGLFINTYGTSHVALTDGQIAEKVLKVFDMRPYAIIERFKLKNPIYEPTASYGHFGRKPEWKDVTFEVGGKSVTKHVELFTWEKLDYVDKVKEAFGL